MKKSTAALVLLVLFIISFFFRFYFFYNTETYDNDQAYYVIRQVESIKSSKTALYDDPLSYGGRENVFSSGFYYMLYLFSIFFPEDIVLKFIPNILASTTIVLIYFIVKQITKNPFVALFSSFIGIFIPIYLLETTNTISPNTVAVPMFLFCSYLFLNIEPKKEWTIILYIISLLIFSVVSAASIIFIMCLLLHIILLKVENMSLTKIKKETIIFSIFCVLWVQFLLFKKALLSHGPYVVWQNIPFEFIINYFSEINILLIIYFVGIVPFFYALYIIYKYFFQKKEDISFFISIVSITTMLLIFRLIKLDLGLILLGICFTIFFGIYYRDLEQYLDKTRFKKFKFWLFISLVIAFLITSILPSYNLLENRQTVNAHSISSLKWIEQNTPKDSVVLGTVEEGNLITSVAKRRSVIDNNFLLISDVNQRLEDIKTIYTSSIVVKALELVGFYGVDYLLIDQAKEEYEIDDLRYKTSDCFRLVHSNKDIKVYKVLCKVEKEKIE